MFFTKLSRWFLVVIYALFFSACQSKAEQPKNVTTSARSEVESVQVDSIEPAPTTEILPSSTAHSPILIITPMPLPTTVPNQLELLREVREDPDIDSVEFVIDTTILEEGRVPFQLNGGENWYKYSPSDEHFSILIPGGLAPQESNIEQTVNGTNVDVNIVQSFDMSELNQQAIAYFDLPEISAGSFDVDKFLDDIGILIYFYDKSVLAHEIDELTKIQLDGFPGRELIVSLTHENVPDAELEMHIRYFVIGDTIYQLTTYGLGKFSEKDERFLESFTINGLSE